MRISAGGREPGMEILTPCDGLSCETAFQVRDISSEYVKLAELFGEMGREWRVVRQAYFHWRGGMYDSITVELAGGGRRECIFRTSPKPKVKEQ